MAKPVVAIVLSAAVGGIALASVMVPRMIGEKSDPTPEGNAPPNAVGVGQVAPVKPIVVGGAPVQPEALPAARSASPSRQPSSDNAAVTKFLGLVASGNLPEAETMLSSEFSGTPVELKATLTQTLTRAKEQESRLAAAKTDSERATRAVAVAEQAAAEAKEIAEQLKANVEASPESASTAPRGGEQIRVVYFSIGSDFVRASEKQSLNDAVTFLEESDKARAVLSGFADPSGNADANRALARRRCEQVKAKLVGAGIAPGRIEVGDSQILEGAVGSDEESADARRVEISLIP